MIGAVCGLGHCIGRICSRGSFKSGDLEFDLVDLEPGDLDAEIQLYRGEMLKLLGKEPLIPAGALGETVVGDGQSAPFFASLTLDPSAVTAGFPTSPIASR